MTVLIQHDFLFVVTYRCDQLSHCSYDNGIICFQSVKIIYRHVIVIYHQDLLFFEDSPVVAFLFLPIFFSTFSLEQLSLRPGAGGTPLFGLYGYVPLDRVWFLGGHANVLPM